MVEKLCEWDHCGIFEVFTKASRDEMSVEPNNIFSAESVREEKFRISFQNSDEFTGILLEFVSFSFDVASHPLVFKAINFGLIPKYGIINILG